MAAFRSSTSLNILGGFHFVNTLASWSTPPSLLLSSRLPSFLPRAALALALPSSFFQPKLPSLLSEICESILRAVPKKKTSHRKKRQRFMAGKALRDVTELNKCSACGNVKRAHLLCPYCARGECMLFMSSLYLLVGCG